MTRQSVSRVVVPMLLLAFAVTAGSAQSKGRYKKQGANCEWDANDTGPNQCTPATKGRFKKDGDACRWDANDNGPDRVPPGLRSLEERWRFLQLGRGGLRARSVQSPPAALKNR